MSTRCFIRQHFALGLTDATPIDTITSSLSEAVAACRAQSVDPSTDAAIQLILDRLGPRPALTEHRRQSLREACRAELWAMARRPIVRCLAACQKPDATRRARFCRVAHHVLHELAERLAWPTGTYDIRTDTGCRYTGGEGVLHGETVYVRIAQSGPSGCEVRYRRCDGRHDFRPRPTLFASAEDAGDPAGLARKIGHDLQLGQGRMPPRGERL